MDTSKKTPNRAEMDLLYGDLPEKIVKFPEPEREELMKRGWQIRPYWVEQVYGKGLVLQELLDEATSYKSEIPLPQKNIKLHEVAIKPYQLIISNND